MLFILSLVFGCKDQYKDIDVSMYQYRDTKQLIRFVYNASIKLKKDGMKGIDYFRAHRELFNSKGHYLYIYDMKGVNIFHAGIKGIEGKDMWSITDKNGKKITKLMLAALKDKNNPHGWVHYSWWSPGKFYVVPKSSCNFKVKTPQGKVFFVGGGINYPQEEKEFTRIVVDDAANLIKEKGEEAFTEISSSSSQYNFRDVHVFAFSPKGKIHISPVLGDSGYNFNLLECVDEVGHKPFIQATKQLKHRNSVWVAFMAKNRYRRELVKKVLYIHKSLYNEQEIYVCAVTDLPRPPY